jgi:hypothetical protein
VGAKGNGETPVIKTMSMAWVRRRAMPVADPVRKFSGGKL